MKIVERGYKMKNQFLIYFQKTMTVSIKLAFMAPLTPKGGIEKHRILG